MPLYEYLCRRCNRIFTFMLPTMAGARTPLCPRCSNDAMEKQISLFAFVRGGTDPLAAIPKVEADEDEAGSEGPGADDAPERDDGLYIVRETGD